mgnify:FL=1
MRNYNKLVVLSLVIYAVLAVATSAVLRTRQDEKGQFYKVEINRIAAEIEDQMRFAVDQPGTNRTDVTKILDSLDLCAYQDIEGIAYLPVSVTDKESVRDFYSGANGTQSAIYPLYMNVYINGDHGTAADTSRAGDGDFASGGEQLAGYLRFDCHSADPGGQYLLLTQGALFVMELFLLIVLFYLRRHLIQPFHRMQDLTYELSKGNLQGDVKADRSQYFGKFLWGLSALKDALRTSRRRELDLQREKKLLLLSLSHDIKTPLSMIKLYAKGLEDGIYPAEDERREAYCQIGEKAAQIEHFVGEIVKASREDIVQIEVVKGEFYLAELVRWVETVYGEKCALRRCTLTVGTYQNRIFRGDLNRLMEVFENLFENAFKYGDGRRIQLTFYEEDYCQLIRVSNTGDPVTERELVHLFDSFFRGGNTRGQQGNGLGLYICREIMNKMGGEIFAECGKDGMAFVVVLPL